MEFELAQELFTPQDCNIIRHSPLTSLMQTKWTALAQIRANKWIEKACWAQDNIEVYPKELRLVKAVCR